MSVSKSDAHNKLADLLVGAKVALLLRAMAEYSVADALADGPKSVEDLADQLDLISDPLRRFMRALAQFGVFEELPDGQFQNTALSECMRSDANPSLKDAILFLNHDVSINAWLRLNETLKDGVSRFEEVNGGPLFSLFGKDQKLADHFAQCMRNLYGAEAAKIASGYPFYTYQSVVDVGGGQGHILAAILLANPDMKGTILDLESTAAMARDFLGKQGLSERTEVFGGSFFDHVPAGHDGYIVKSVLHDWEDEQALSILAKCREAMDDDSDILIIEEIVRPGKRVGNLNRMVDPDLMIHLGGRERTEQEYRDLMTQTGFTVTAIHAVPSSFFSIIQGSKTN